MGTKSIYYENNIIKAILHFAIPGILSILIAELYNMVDTFFVGRYVGADSIGALSVVFPLQRLVIAISVCLGIGVSNLISRRLGEKRNKDITKYTTAVNGLTLLIIFAVTIITILFVEDICMFLGARNNILMYSIKYLRIVMCGSIFLAFTTVFGYMNIAYGNMKVMLIASSIGALINNMLAKAGIKFPVYLMGMVVAAIIRNILDFNQKQLPFSEIGIVGNISLSLFLSMALMSMKLWQLIDLAVPLIIILLVQTVLMAFFAYFITFNIMGRDYDAAVMSTGHCGFGLGATPNAMANMETFTKANGQSVKAFFIIPIVGSLFIDFINAGVIQTFASWIVKNFM